MATQNRFKILPTLLAALVALAASAALAQPLPTAQPESVGMSSDVERSKVVTAFGALVPR